MTEDSGDGAARIENLMAMLADQAKESPVCGRTNMQLAAAGETLDQVLADPEPLSPSDAEAALMTRAWIVDRLERRAQSGDEEAAVLYKRLIPVEDDIEPRLQMTDFGLRCEWYGGTTVSVINTCIECEEDAFEIAKPTEACAGASMRAYLDRAIAETSESAEQLVEA